MLVNAHTPESPCRLCFIRPPSRGRYKHDTGVHVYMCNSYPSSSKAAKFPTHVYTHACALQTASHSMASSASFSSVSLARWWHAVMHLMHHCCVVQRGRNQAQPKQPSLCTSLLCNTLAPRKRHALPSTKHSDWVLPLSRCKAGNQRLHSCSSTTPLLMAESPLTLLRLTVWQQAAAKHASAVSNAEGLC